MSAAASAHVAILWRLTVPQTAPPKFLHASYSTKVGNEACVMQVPASVTQDAFQGAATLWQQLCGLPSGGKSPGSKGTQCTL